MHSITHRAASVDDAVAQLARQGDAKLLAGGHSLIPSMKLRLASPGALIDIGHLGELNYVREQGGAVAIGAATTHHTPSRAATWWRGRHRCWGRPRR